ncbi:formimidoylglutamase [Natrarchaeobaculum sulfurireducens]|uniref:Formimidoylglutamase n=1 Tax=Natrarchaeobaculum sulfurireducens TaxID=2044521 RepID=A0A346PH18_9EURY|nr:formimidoylglutamase [Natrarchaeobaculum sulfurireducens]AXR78813.1 Arginase family enzyme [Natrarchaeobaculum sulfurireducens]
MTRADPPVWSSPSSDPADETFGDVVEPIRVEPDEPVRAADLEAYDAVLVGEPFDAAVIGRTGARDGPDAIREALAGVKSHHFTAGSIAAVGDYGDVEPATTDLESIREGVREAAETVHESAALPVFLGGDNSLTVPNVVPLLEHGRVGVVNLDAHLDVRAVRAEPTSGTPYRELLEAGLDAYTCVGVRHFETSTVYADYLEERGGTVVTAADVGRDLEGALDRARDAVSDVDAVYVSVDCDVLDAAHAPGVSAPTPGGLTPRELFRLVYELARDHRLVGLEVVECAPPLDRNGRTADAAARVVAHALAGATSRGDGNRHGDRGGERR